MLVFYSKNSTIFAIWGVGYIFHSVKLLIFLGGNLPKNEKSHDLAKLAYQ